MPVYIAIDLKSFYASVECAERKLDPLTTNLVVADSSRTEKTICLAVSPSLKAYGIPGRARLFEVVQRVQQVNANRLHDAIRAGKAVRRTMEKNGKKNSEYGFSSSSWDAATLAQDLSLAVDYIVAPPRMAVYMEYSTRIYSIYLKYVAPEDIHVYSIDECFIDVTNYLKTYGMSPRELAMTMIREVLYTTGITATGGIGSNLYLAKVAMDIVAKHVQPDKDGVRIAELDEQSYREQLWAHQPLTDFWRVGKGIAQKLEKHQMYTMGDVARCSLGDPRSAMNEDLLYKLFGVNAELLIDHAWGWEPCRISDIKQYKPSTNSLSSGQVLASAYDYEKGKLIVREMTDLLVLDLVNKHLVTDQIALCIGYDTSSLSGEQGAKYTGEVVQDHYGRSVPKHANGTENLGRLTSSTQLIMRRMIELYERIVDPTLLIRRVNVVANHVVRETEKAQQNEQMDFFSILDTPEQQPSDTQDERALQETMLALKKKFGKNAILKGMNLQDGGTTIQRNKQVGGHRA